jgi:hypothetical protein
MMVNSADVTDPATGKFGLTVPIDSVDARGRETKAPSSPSAARNAFSAGLFRDELLALGPQSQVLAGLLGQPPAFLRMK